MQNLFHLAFPVQDLEESRKFYSEILGCEEGRSSADWVDFNLFGHQIVAHLAPDAAGVRHRAQLRQPRARGALPGRAHYLFRPRRRRQPALQCVRAGTRTHRPSGARRHGREPRGPRYRVPVWRQRERRARYRPGETRRTRAL